MIISQTAKEISIIYFRAYLIHPFTANHASHADGYYWYGEYLAHVERQACLERFLYVLDKFYQEARREHQRQAKSDIESTAHLLRMLLVDGVDYQEEASVGYGLIKLARMARVLVYLLEDKRPRHVSHIAYNLRVHEVAQADEGGRDARADAHVVEHRPHVHLVAISIDEDGYYHAYHASMRGKALIASELPRAVGHEMDWHKHLNDMFA